MAAEFKGQDCVLFVVGVLVAERPYIQLSIEALESLAASSASDATILADLIEELGHRKMGRAQRLRYRLEAGAPLGASGNCALSSVRDTHAGEARAEAADDQGGPDDELASIMAASDQEYSVLLEKYESLRATFTAEAELLARWGMTPALPRDMQDFIFSQWNKKLSKGKRVGSLSPNDLADDRERLTQERAHLRNIVGAHGGRGTGGLALTPSRGEG